MIDGRGDRLQGAFIRGLVSFPAPVSRTISVDFFLDTGASISCLMPSAILRLDADSQERLASLLQPAAVVRGIGGTVEPYAVQADVAFVHTDGATSEFRVQVGLLADPSYIDVPSILGRDVLFRGQLSAGRDGVSWDVEPGEHDLTA